MLRVFPVKTSDLKAIEALTKEEYRKENLFDDAVILGHDLNIAGYGALEKYAEAVMVLDEKLKKRDRVRAFRKLMDLALGAVYKKKLREVHVFCKPEFTPILMKHYKFTKPVEDHLILRIP